MFVDDEILQPRSSEDFLYIPGAITLTVKCRLNNIEFY